MSHERKRQSKGKSTGGQFAPDPQPKGKKAPTSAAKDKTVSEPNTMWNLQIIKEKGKVTTVLCKKHWSEYVLTHTSGTWGSLHYAINTKTPSLRELLLEKKELYCRECAKISGPSNLVENKSKTPLDYVKERRTEAEGSEILEKAIKNLRQPDAENKAEIVHRCPPEGEGLTPCCGRTPFELHPKSRMTVDDSLVTCGANRL